MSRLPDFAIEVGGAHVNGEQRDQPRPDASGRNMVHLTSTHLKRAGLALLTIPILILVGLAVGELAGGDISGLQHVVQVVPLAVLAWVAWRRPLWGRMALVVLALIFTGLYFIFIPRFPLPIVILTVASLFVTPIVAGILFVVASRQEREGRSGY
jgi:hypothetical protein